VVGQLSLRLRFGRDVAGVGNVGVDVKPDGVGDTLAGVNLDVGVADAAAGVKPKFARLCWLASI
jgi:hypothetical protein